MSDPKIYKTTLVVWTTEEPMPMSDREFWWHASRFNLGCESRTTVEVTDPNDFPQIGDEEDEDDKRPAPHVVVVGNPFDGLMIYGPFADHNDAEMFGSLDNNGEDWWVVELEDPAS
jgi:hypothetical protein